MEWPWEAFEKQKKKKITLNDKMCECFESVMVVENKKTGKEEELYVISNIYGHMGWHSSLVWDPQRQKLLVLVRGR